MTPAPADRRARAAALAFGISAFAAFAAFAAAFAAAAQTGVPSLDRRLLVVLTGDSITEGVITDSSLAIPPGVSPADAVCWRDLCYAAIVRARLAELAARGEIEPVLVGNRGVGGATSRDWDPDDFRVDDLHFLANTTLYGNQGLFYNIPAADVVVHYVGTNDAVAFFEEGPPLTPRDYASKLVDFAVTLRRRGVAHVLLATPPVPVGWRGTEQGVRMQLYGEAVRQACAHLNEGFGTETCLVELQREFPDDVGWEGDAIHPTAAGHAFIAERVLEAIVPLVAEPRVPLPE
ncbi:MAG: SGNH/GDSL hydrolase family protein [Myxococcota bacterium]